MALRSALGLAGLGAQKIPKNESEHGEEDHQDRPENFLSGIRAALKDVDDRPDIGDQNYKAEQTLVLHFLSSLLLLRRYATPLRALRERKHSALPLGRLTTAMRQFHIPKYSTSNGAPLA